MTRVFRSGPNPVTWLPELSPGTLILETAPSGFDPLRRSTRPTRLRSSLTDTDDEGRELVIVDGSGELHIRLPQRSGRTTPSHSLPLDIVISIFGSMSHCASCAGFVASASTFSPPPFADAATKRRLVQLLHAFDVHDLGVAHATSPK